MAWIAVTQVGAQVRIGAGGLCVIVAMAATALWAWAPAACWCLGCAVTRAAATTTLSATAAAGRALGVAGRAAARAAGCQPDHPAFARGEQRMRPESAASGRKLSWISILILGLVLIFRPTGLLGERVSDRA